MKPLVKGNITNLVEIPANWYLDDLPPHMFIKGRYKEKRRKCTQLIYYRFLKFTWFR
jgi:hypothetical protein